MTNVMNVWRCEIQGVILQSIEYLESEIKKENVK
jgi:hypothetical protein